MIYQPPKQRNLSSPSKETVAQFRMRSGSISTGSADNLDHFSEPVMSYPTENEVDDGGFFPVREPGDFPSAG